MLIVFLVISIIMLICGIFTYADWRSDGSIGLITIGGISSFVCLIVACFGIVGLQDISLADQKIQMCEEENKRIELQVEITVNQYLEYEQGIIDKIDISKYSGDKLLLISQLYPDLKANTLLQQQLELYVKNNDQIRKLKLDKLNNSKWKFWLYFGN